jgi:N-hydroxyarylamine O-acetyltransferase
MNLDAYFERIGYAGERAATLPVLRGVVAAHVCSVPFENLDVLLGRGISLEDAAVERKLVADRRGGYCFEQNSLLMRALAGLGFRVSPLSARVRLKLPREATPPRTHLFLRVEIEGRPWLADVGVGGLSPTAPVRLDLLDAEQPTPHEPRRIVREPGEPFPRYFHQARLGDEWADVYEFTLEGMPTIDRELGNWWTSTHPASKFRQNLFAALARPDGTRVSILNREFTHRRGAEILERFDIPDADALLAVLAGRFGLRFPPGTRFGPPGSPWPT